MLIYFKDGTKIMRWNNIPAGQIIEKGYLPFIKLSRPNSEVKYQKQLRSCTVSKLITPDNNIPE